MSEARLLYNHVVDSLKDKQVRDTIRTYVDELEQQITELKESQKQKQIIRLCQRLDKAEQQISGICKWKYDENYNMYETDCEHAFIFIEGRKSDNGFLFCPYCGKKIEEALNGKQRIEDWHEGRKILGIE